MADKVFYNEASAAKLGGIPLGCVTLTLMRSW